MPDIALKKDPRCCFSETLVYINLLDLNYKLSNEGSTDTWPLLQFWNGNSSLK